MKYFKENSSVEVYFTCNVTSLLDNFWIADLIAIMFNVVMLKKKKKKMDYGSEMRHWSLDMVAPRGALGYFFGVGMCCLGLQIGTPF